MSIDQPLHLQIPGKETNIKGPKERYFAKTTLPWMSIGYEISGPPRSNITDLLQCHSQQRGHGTPQVCGKPVKDGEVVERISDGSNQSQDLFRTIPLTQIREFWKWYRRLAKPAGSKQFSVAGKRVRAIQVSQGVWLAISQDETNYFGSFCGYFPSERRYSCIVLSRNRVYRFQEV